MMDYEELDDDFDNIDDFDDDFDLFDDDDYDDTWDPESYLDYEEFLDHDDYYDAVEQIRLILQTQGPQRAAEYARQYSWHDNDIVYRNNNVSSVGEEEMTDAKRFHYKVIYTNAPIGEDMLNDFSKQGYRLAFIINQNSSSWISYMEKIENDESAEDSQENLSDVPF